MGIYQGNELTRSWSGNARQQSSQLAEPLWIDHGLKSGTGARDLISIKGKKKNGKEEDEKVAANNSSNPLLNS